jgi:RHS repeat-associated protein
MVWGMIGLALTLVAGLVLVFAGVLPNPLASEPENPPERTDSKSGSGKPSEGLSWRFDRDETGRISRVVDPAGRQTRFRREFNSQGGIRRLVKEAPGGSRIVLEYDDSGRRLRRQDSTGTVRYGYDDEGRLATVARPGGPTIAYTYDAEDRLQSVSLGNGLRIGYAYDFLGRLARIDTPAGGIDYEYVTGSGSNVRRLPNGIRTTWRYHPSGRLESIIHAGADNLILARFTYAYRPDGLVREVKEWSRRGERTLAYEYDKVQRLVSVTDSRTGKVVFGYDPLGNRTGRTGPGGEKMTATHDWAGRLKLLNGKQCSHDGVGNLTAYETGRGRLKFDFSPSNALQAAQVKEGKVSYQHDGDGNLVSRTVGKERTVYVPDPASDSWHPLLATHAAGKSTLYVWDGDLLLAAITGGDARFFLHDHLGSVRHHADGQGKLLASFDYRAFGAPLDAPEGVALLPGFAGLFYDPRAGLYLARARVGDPVLGRWLQRLRPDQRKPGSSGDLSPYAYCGNDPVNFVDPQGRHPRAVLIRR